MSGIEKIQGHPEQLSNSQVSPAEVYLSLEARVRAPGETAVSTEVEEPVGSIPYRGFRQGNHGSHVKDKRSGSDVGDAGWGMGV